MSLALPSAFARCTAIIEWSKSNGKLNYSHKNRIREVERERETRTKKKHVNADKMRDMNKKREEEWEMKTTQRSAITTQQMNKIDKLFKLN